jgi:flagellar biosynthesis/type III secretory pathway protein FliH
MIQGAKHIEIVGLPQAPAGTCILETPTGIVDASLDTQMDKIKEAFAGVETLLPSTLGDMAPFAD